MVLSQRRRSARRRPWRGRALAGVEAAPRAPRRSPVRPLALRKGQRQRRRSQWDCGDDCWAGGTAAALCFFCAPEPRPSTPTARAGRQPVLAILDRVVRAARGSLAAGPPVGVGRSGLGDASGGPLSLCACACRLVLTTRAALCFCVCQVLAAVVSFGGLSTKIADDDLVRTPGFSSLLLRRCRRRRARHHTLARPVGSRTAQRLGELYDPLHVVCATAPPP